MSALSNRMYICLMAIVFLKLFVITKAYEMLWIRKYINVLAVAMIALVVSGAASADTASIERATEKDVEMLLSAASGMNSAYWASLIGEARGRVYIEYETAVHASSSFTKELKRIVYWLPRTEITDEQMMLFREYKNRFESGQ